jgi:carbamoyltransferase
MSNVLGIHFGHDAAVAIVKDGKLVSSITNERVTRVKKGTGIVTKEILQYVLDEAGLSAKDIDAVAVSSYFEDNENIFSFMFNRSKTDLINSSSDDEIVFPFNEFSVGEVSILGLPPVKAYQVPHHFAHGSSTYYTSNFNKSIILTVDACSPDTQFFNSLIAIGDENKFIYQEDAETMISQLYNYFTASLGLGHPLLKAGSMMGLAAYGKPIDKAVKNIEEYVIKFNSPGNALNKAAELFFELTDHGSPITGDNINCFGTYEDWDEKDKLLSKKLGRDLAATIQYIFEESMMYTIKEKVSQYGIKNISLAGGSLLNCNANSKIKNSGLFDNVYIYPAAGDDGIAIGCALYVSHHILNEKRHKYSNSDIAYTGKKYKMSIFTNHKKVAKLIADGKIVAWFSGASENGPRALGHRSILADPRNFNNRDIINFAVKRREWFRPFAPSVLEEEAHKWFSPGDPSPFMLYTQKVLKPELVPAITHVDGTARIQTVSKEMDKDYYSLINEFYKLTGVPMILNTSFNTNGEPIVETEEDALNAFKNNDGLDVLVLNGKIYER